MEITKDHSEQETPILIKDDGIIQTYRNQVNGRDYTVLGEIIPNVAQYQVKKYKGIIYWSPDMSLLKQVGVLKKICPLIYSLSNSELLKNIKGTLKWEFGVFLPEEAEEIVSKAKENKLNILMIELK